MAANAPGPHARVSGYRWGLRCCAHLGAAALAVSCFIGQRKGPNIFDDSR